MSTTFRIILSGLLLFCLSCNQTQQNSAASNNSSPQNTSLPSSPFLLTTECPQNLTRPLQNSGDILIRLLRFGGYENWSEANLFYSTDHEKEAHMGVLYGSGENCGLENTMTKQAWLLTEDDWMVAHKMEFYARPAGIELAETYAAALSIPEYKELKTGTLEFSHLVLRSSEFDTSRLELVRDRQVSANFVCNKGYIFQRPIRSALKDSELYHDNHCIDHPTDSRLKQCISFELKDSADQCRFVTERIDLRSYEGKNLSIVLEGEYARTEDRDQPYQLIIRKINVQ
jgi:hypothetical protein